MALLKSYEIDECSSQELVEMLSKESLLGSGDCAVANFSIRLSNPAGASETNPAMCKVFNASLSCGLPGLKFGM